MTVGLIHRIIRKDSKAEYEFYKKYSPGMFRLAYRYVCNPQDAGSIVNFGFYKIFNNLSVFVYADEAGLMAWMKRIVINESLMHLRKQKAFYSTDEMAENIDNRSIKPDDSLRMEDYYRMIQELSDDLRTVFNLYAIDGYSHKEIAEQLGITESSSRVYLSRARQILRKKITPNN